MFLRVDIFVRYHGCAVWVLAAFWGTLFQLAILPFNWIDRVMEDLGNKVGQILSVRASRNRTVAGQDDQVEEKATIDGAAKNYHWWPTKAMEG